MKKPLLRQLIMLSQRILYAFIIQLFFCSVLLAYEGNAQRKTIDQVYVTMKESSTSLRGIFNQIEKQTDFSFTYNPNAISFAQEVILEINKGTVYQILESLTRQTNLSFVQINDNIHVKSQEVEIAPVSINNELLISIRGKVTDPQGNPLPGVTVLVEGTTTGTVTNGEGNFTLNVKDGDVLVFSFIGYTTQRVTIANQSEINIQMAEDSRSLDEIVVTGYGEQRKRDLTGAVSSVKAEQIKSVPVMGADQALIGRVSGVQVIQSSGAPGGGVQVRVRGVNSTAGDGANQPLYVIDGIPLTWNERANSLGIGNEGQTGGSISNNSSPLASINPNDIESIEVLKDASATAIYGSRASNGVVLITTKSGKAGKTQFSFDSYYGVQTLRRKIPMTNARERAGYLFEHRRNAGTRGNEVWDIVSVNPFLLDEGTDWQDEIFREASIQNYSLTANGGTEKIQFLANLDYFNQEGIVVSTGSERISTRINLDVQANERLKFGTRTALSYQTSNGLDTDDFFQSQLMNGSLNSPLGLVYDFEGNFAGRPNTVVQTNLVTDGNSNAVANIIQNTRRADRYRINSSIFGEYEITKGLKFKTLIGIDYLLNELTSFRPVWVRGVDINNTQQVGIFQPKTFNRLIDNYLTFDKVIGEHRINVVGGISAQQFIDKTMGAIGQGSPSNSLDQLGNQPTPVGISGGETRAGLVSQFIRTNYAFKDKYLFTGTVRRDGSSRFGENNKYGVFPSFSLGWRVSDEAFMKNVKFIQDLKVRGSYGITGNQNIGDFLYASLMGTSNTVFGNSVVAGNAPTRFENPNIRWEKNKQTDIGIDFGIFNGRITISADYYNKLTDGLLGPAPLSVISGVGNSYITNVGKIKNSGFEFAIGGFIVDKKNFRWEADFNLATNKNEVIDLGTLPFVNGATIWRANAFINRTQVGQPIGAFYVLQERGQYKTWEEASTAPRFALGNQPYFAPGDFKPVDQNGDKVIDDNDRVFVGSPFPTVFGGFGTTITSKGISLNIVGNFQTGNLLWNQPRLNAETFEANTWRSVYENRWLPSQPTITTTVPIPRNNNPLLPSDRFLEDASFLRIRTITLGYEIPRELIGRFKLNRVRIYAQGNNLLTFTRYTGWDPEVNSFGSNVVTNGIDAGAYPLAKSFIVGLNLEF